MRHHALRRTTKPERSTTMHDYDATMSDDAMHAYDARQDATAEMARLQQQWEARWVRGEPAPDTDARRHAMTTATMHDATRTKVATLLRSYRRMARDYDRHAAAGR